MATAGLADIHNNSCGCTAMKKTLIATGWQPPQDSKNKQTFVEAHLVAPVPGLVQDSDRLEQPTTEQIGRAHV